MTALRDLWFGPTPVPSPIVSVGAPNPAPSSGPDVSTILDTANLSIQMAMALLTLIGLVLAAAAFIGIRELRSLRTARRELDRLVAKTEALQERMEGALRTIGNDIEILVQAATLYRQGQVAYDADDFAQAVALFEAAVRLQPDNVRLLTALARAHTNLGNDLQAEHHLRRAIDLSPEHAPALVAMASNLRYSDPEEALRWIKKAVTADPRNAKAWNYLGLLQRDGMRLREAIDAHRVAERYAPADPISSFYLGLIYWRMNRPDEAQASIARAMALLSRSEWGSRPDSEWVPLTIKCIHSLLLGGSRGRAAATRLAKQINEVAVETRTRRAVVSHLLFALGPSARDKEGGLHPCLQAFGVDAVADSERSEVGHQ